MSKETDQSWIKEQPAQMRSGLNPSDCDAGVRSCNWRRGHFSGDTRFVIRPASRRRGSVYLVVMTILAVLALLTITLTYTAQMEIQASGNWTEGIQARIAAVTGVPAFEVSAPQGNLLADDTRESPDISGVQRLAINPSLRAGSAPSLSRSAVTDESAKMNVNAIRRTVAGDVEATAGPAPAAAFFTSAGSELWTARQASKQPGASGISKTTGSLSPDDAEPPLQPTVEQFASLIEAILEAEGVDASISPIELAEALVAYRDGPDGVPPEEGASADIRRNPAGDDRLFIRLGDILRVPGMTTEIFNALGPYLTVFSVSAGAFPDRSGSKLGIPQIDPNTATPQEIYEALEAKFPEKPPELLGQWVANLVDRLDEDSVPTRLQLGPDEKTYHGLEIAPFINEVCPDAPSLDEDGDDGQFVEIFNPFSEAIDVEGWRLESGGISVTLHGSIASRGFLVVTDDGDDSGDGTPAEETGQGSLYDAFGVVPTGPSRRILVEPAFDIPNAWGEIRLYDFNGNLVDSFAYKNGVFNGAPWSFQRIDPKIRRYQRALATPLRPNRDAVPHGAADEERLKLIEMWHNHPIQSSLEVMLISTAFWENDATQPSDLALGWRLPTLTDDDGDNFDVSLIDLFMPGLPRRETRAESSTEPPETTPARLPPRAGQAAPDSDGFGPRENPLLDGSFSLHGRININTAAPILLASLLGLDPALASRIAALRGAPADVGRPPGLTTSVQSPGAVPGTQAWLQSRAPHFPPRWGSLSEFVADEDLWRGVTLSERFARIYPFSRMIAFHSLSYKVISESLPAPSGGNKNRRASRFRTERVIAGDRGKIETVTFRYW